MKLRNKKTGEIGLVHCDATMFSNKIGVFIDNNHIDLRNPYKIYTSLTELNEEWEDAPEEPKEHWCITMYGGITRIKDDEEPIDDLIEIGNYFNSKEDAYDAWDKLKAWKRLKDKGFSIYSWDYEFDMVDKPAQTIILRASAVDSSNEDLDICFGGEE